MNRSEKPRSTRTRHLGAVAVITVLLGGASLTVGPSAALAQGSCGSAPVTLTFYSGGDVNVQDLWSNQLLPMYKKVAPNVNFNLVFSEHSANDNGTLDRLAAAKQAGKPSGVDLWETGLLDKAGKAGLVEKVANAKILNMVKVPSEVVQEMSGYGVPYRGSSVVMAYNSSLVKNPPKTLDALFAWIKANPGQFTYNTPGTGGSGDAFVTRVLETSVNPKDLRFFHTGYDAKMESQWDKGWALLKSLDASMYQNGRHPNGNAAVLQLLAKGEISLAPVWSDMGLSYLSQNLLPPEVKLYQIDPPLSGGASYVGVSRDSAHKCQAFAFLNWILTPAAQTVVVNKMNGYPGLDWKFMPADVRAKYAEIAKSYSVGFSSSFFDDVKKMWYEKIAGTPAPAK